MNKEYRPPLDKIEDEYKENILSDDDRMYKIKSIIFNQLDDLDRALLIMYSDDMSMAKTAKKFGVSPATIYSRIVKIRNIIKNKLEV